MSCLLTTSDNTVNGDGLLHITSGTRTKDELQNNSILSDTVFSSTYKNMISIADTFEYTFTGAETITTKTTGYLTGNWCKNHCNISNLNTFIRNSKNLILAYIYNPATGDRYSLHNQGGLSMMDYYTNASSITSGSGIAIGCFYTDATDTTLNTLGVMWDGSITAINNMMTNRSGVKLYVYKLDIVYDVNARIINTVAETFVNDIEMSSKDIKINGVSIANRKVLLAQKSLGIAADTPQLIGYSTLGSSGVYYGALTISNTRIPTPPVINALTLARDGILASTSNYGETSLFGKTLALDIVAKYATFTNKGRGQDMTYQLSSSTSAFMLLGTGNDGDAGFSLWTGRFAYCSSLNWQIFTYINSPTNMAAGTVYNLHQFLVLYPASYGCVMTPYIGVCSTTYQWANIVTTITRSSTNLLTIYNPIGANITIIEW